MIIHATKGTSVRFWTGLREGEGRLGELSYDGVHEIGGSWSVYIKGVGSVTPVTEETARLLASQIAPEPVSRWDVQEMVKQSKRQLPERGDDGR